MSSNPAQRAEGVVLVHGGFHSAKSWDPVLEQLSLPAVAVDLPGRGRCPADLASITLADCVEAVIAEADAAGFDRFVLVGHSIGGVRITEAAWRFPRRVEHLLYVGAIVPPPGGSAAIVITGADLPPGPMPMIDKELAKAYFANDLDDHQWEQHWSTFTPETANVLNARLSGYPEGIPITYVSLTDDVPVPPAVAKAMIANLGGSVHLRVLTASHSVMASKPRELADVITSIAGDCLAKSYVHG